jgi:K+-sensing histidine kinase KdpD
VRTGEPIILGSSAERLVRYPHLTSIESLIGEGASVTLPLVIDGRSVGVMYLSFATARVFDPDDRAFLLAIAHQCSIAVERARLYEAERVVVEGKEPVVANVDRLHVKQVIGNLLDNALKYGGDGPIVVRVSQEDRSAIVAIADQGVGIPPEGGSRFILTLPLDPDTSSGDLELAHRQLPLVDLGSGDD